MNEGESAGGGHQRASPAPPAVSDQKTVSSTKNFANTNINSELNTSTSFIAAATPEVHQAPIATLVPSRGPRSFQQAFTQQQLYKQQHTSDIVGVKAPASVTGQHSQNSSVTQKFHSAQVSQPQQLHMPQTSVRSPATATAVAATIGATGDTSIANTSAEVAYLLDPTSESVDTRQIINSSPPPKRQKISSVAASVSNTFATSLLPSSGSAADNSNTAVSAPQELNALNERISENKYLRLRSLEESTLEYVAELFYLQSGGNMMDFPTWRKKPPTPQFVSFCNAYRLDKLVSEEKAAALVQQQQQTKTDTIATVIGLAGNQIQQQSSSIQKQTQEYLTGITTKTQNSQSHISSGISSDGETINIVTGASTSSAAVGGTNLPTADASAEVLPQGAEIKIPAVGATPVAVSTKLPAAVVQLTQQGHIPGRPLGGRHGMVFGQIPTPPAVGNSTVPLVPGGTPLVPAVGGGSPAVLRRNGNGATSAAAGAQGTGQMPTVPQAYSPTPNAVLVPASVNGAALSSGNGLGTAVGAANGAQEFSFKAKQEVYVMQRISELQREGLWTEKRLPKQQEPSRPKAHWDYLLEEMVWLAADFAQERKWKKAAAKKCAKMVQKYFQDKANAAQKAEKAQEAHLKRIAAFISKEVKMFWSNVEKLVEYKHQTKLEEKRKKALDQHLSFIVDQTEKFSQQLAEGMNKTVIDATGTSAAPSINSSRISSPKQGAANGSDDDFKPESGSEDDEETIAKAEEEAADVKEEVAALEKESQMDLDDFLKDLPKGYLENRDKILLTEEADSKMESDQDDDTEEDAEFQAIEKSDDDENTISKQEQEEMDVDHQKEIDELEADNNLSVEQLLEKYKSGKIDEPLESKRSSAKKRRLELDSDDDSSSDNTSDDDIEESQSDSEIEGINNSETSSEESEENDQEDGLKSLIEDVDGNSKDDMIKDAAALAESLQPKGNTLSSTNVVTPVPFLLKHSLREYQHIGLDWLVTMNERKLNGILADEMGLGKTIQTIALLAHLACVKGNWGPHLIVVPSSVMLNWEMEFKKWCPGFKILTYYGTQKERKMKRVGWTKPNAFHVCITSYKLVVQDQQSFRRKKWKYLILDEAQNIKNFKSQRWQLLLNFSTERRLLLTGTPLQNDLMELWSLMHFLMPSVFSSHREFKEWFSNPMTGMIEGNTEYNETLISRLHKVIRPFLLRRLKKEVEKQMPKKYEHVVMCRLSNRQRYLYDDFMSRTKTKETLQTGNLLSVINILMQLRKVCNHPNMFEVRPIISPFQMEGITYQSPRLVFGLLQYDPFTQIDLQSFNLLLIELELILTAYASYKSRLLAPPRKLIEEIDSMPEPPPLCPRGKFKFYIRIRDQQVQENLSRHNTESVRVGASPAMKTEGNKLVPVHEINSSNSKICKSLNNINPVNAQKVISLQPENWPSGNLRPVNNTQNATTNISTTRMHVTTPTNADSPPPPKIAKLAHGSGKPYLFVNSGSIINDTKFSTSSSSGRPNLVRTNSTATATASTTNARIEGTKLLSTLAQQVKAKVGRDKGRMSMEVEDDNSKQENENDPAFDPIFNMKEILEKRKETRLARLKLMAAVNKRRVGATPIYGEDCRISLQKLVGPSDTLKHSSWQTRSYTNCKTAMLRHDDWSLTKILKTYEMRVAELRQMFQNFVIYVPSACAPRIRFFTQHLTSTHLLRERRIEETITRDISPKLTLLHPVISAMSTQFPDPRLIQYDCGKLQTLDLLLRQLKSDQHRVLIFTQMTKMLDVLEAFLNYHGHIYLRLDGSTRVEQRQVLMERFNGDKRIFCFILSTRSGGVGVNLTGADTVIFYDSDWNPTMDAQAQDRCHRIGQTRDVHIYRLVSEKTIEVNILKKANQKRMLSDMAIEGGNFTTTYFKSSTIKDLFNMDQPEQDIDSASAKTGKVEKASSSAAISSEIETEKQSLRAFESALAAAEDEQDVQATKIAKAEAAADLAEFDETIPIDETAVDSTVGVAEMSKADLEMQNLVKQLSPIERYAMRFVEETGAAWTAEQLRAAEEEIEAQKREWEANRLAALAKEEEMLKQEANDELLTYSRKDAMNQIWISHNSTEEMPIWCPPTPPQDDSDLYIDYSLAFMYEMVPMSESELPPVYVKKDYKRTRTDAGFADGSRRNIKMRRDDNFTAPRSLFDRPSAATARIRRDLKNQRYRGVFKPNIQIQNLKPHLQQKQLEEPESMADWGIYEDIVILHVLVNLQGLPCNLMILSPGHTPNWDLVSEIVNFQSKTYRSPKQCRLRYETVIQPREEGKFVDSPKKQKKMKAILKTEYLKGPLRYLRTTYMHSNDNNTSFMKLMRSRFDAIKTAYLKKAPPPKRHFSAPSPMNPKHMEVLQEFGILNYDHPISPEDMAAMRANKMREKQRSQCPPPPIPGTTGISVTIAASAHGQHQQSQQVTTIGQQQIQEFVAQQQNVSVTGNTVTATVQSASSLHAQQLQIQHIPSGSVQQSTATAIVLQHAVQHQQQTAITSTSQPQLIRSAGISNHPGGTTQIVKAIVAPQSGLLTANQMQQLTQGGSQHVQLQQSNVGTPSSVSVVLTTPVQALPSNVQSSQQGAHTPNAQIVSISPQTIVSNSSQTGGSIVQTLPSQTLPQVVSVSQLATVGTVLTTSANLQPSATVTTLNPSALRAQRIVAATTGTLQDVVLQQRTSNPSPTIVSMSNLGPNVATQFQAAQLRLASMSGNTQQVTKVPVSSLQQSGKISASSGNQPAHIQLYRQRQQLKVLPATSSQGGGQTLVQTAGGQTALVNAAGTIIQGNLVQTAGGQTTMQVQGQKVASSNIAASSGGPTPVATVQVSHPGRTQFLKHMGKTITRQMGDDMVLVKRQLINNQKPGQVLQPGQIFNTGGTGSGTVQLQHGQSVATSAGQQQQQQSHGQTHQIQQVTAQQIATLVKSSGGAANLQQTSGSGSGVTVSTAGGQTQGTVNMALSHIKSGGQIKVTTSLPNQSQLRQIHMQPLAIPRKISRMTQMATAGQGNVNAGNVVAGQQVATSVGQASAGATVVQQAKNVGNMQTQLVHIQNAKSLPSSVTVQQIQQVMRQGQQGSLATTGLVLSKSGVGRVIPVSVAASQQNPRQTIQVVSASSAQALAAGNLRAHVTGGQNIGNTIKVGTTGGNQSQTQAILTAIQQQVAAQQGQRQNPSPVRLQTTASGNLVAVVQQQSIQQQQNVSNISVAGPTTSANAAASAQGEVMTITQTVAAPSGGNQQQQQQQATTQQVRTLVKKKLLQQARDKEC